MIPIHIPFFEVDFTLNIVDVLFCVLLTFFVFEEISSGLTIALQRTISIVITFFSGVFFYRYLVLFIPDGFPLAKGVEDGLAVLIISSIAAGLCWFVIRLTFKKRVITLQRGEMVFSAICALISFFFIASFLFTILLSLPTSFELKNTIARSLPGSLLIPATQLTEQKMLFVLGNNGQETLQFLTVSPDFQDSLPLHFSSTNPQEESYAEKKLFEGINKIREVHGLAPFIPRPSLSKLARQQAKVVVQGGLLTHKDTNEFSFIDRIDVTGVVYTVASELLAVSESEITVLPGFLNFKDTKSQLLSKEFKYIGISVLQAGNDGKIFVVVVSD